MAQPQAIATPGAAIPPGGGFNQLPDPATITVSTPETSVVETPAVEVNEAEQHAEGEARTHGWVGKDEWVSDGKDPSRWRPATEFLDVRRSILSVVQQENKELRARVAALATKQELKEREETQARLRLTGDTLRQELRQAQEDRDDGRIADITQKMIDHGIEAKVAARPATPQVDPEVQRAFSEFGASNKWLNNDIELRTDFLIELKKIAEVAPQMDMATALTQAKRRVVQANPTKFRSNGGGGTPMVETGGTGGHMSGGGKTWNDLLPEVRSRAEDDIRQKKYSKEDFLAQCDGPEYFRR